MTQVFRLQASGTEISVQRYTSDVPSDGKYYLVNNGKIAGSYKTKTAAVTAFRKLLKEMAYEPPDKPEPVSNEDLLREQREDVEHYRSLMYWSRSHEYRDGGKGR